MSKATDWAKVYAASGRPELTVGHLLDPVGRVTDDGHLRVSSDLNAAQALRLAAWIVETFSE